MLNKDEIKIVLSKFSVNGGQNLKYQLDGFGKHTN